MFLSKVVLAEYVDVLRTIRVCVLVVVVFVVDVAAACRVADVVLEEVDMAVACHSVDVEVVEVEVEGTVLVLVVVLVVEVETFDADSLASPDPSEISESSETLPARPNASIEVLAKSAVT